MRPFMATLALAGGLTAAACGRGGDLLLPSEQAVFATDAPEHTLTRTDRGLEGDIAFTFRNPLPGNVYVVNCNGIAPPLLEKKVGDDWVVAWGAAVPDCLSDPIVIRPGATYRDTLEVFAGLPGSNYYPKFEVAEVEGVYRLRWEKALTSFDPDRYPFGEPVPLAIRTSREFVLRVSPP